MPEIPSHFYQSHKKDFPYFRPLWNSIVLSLLAASFIPLILIGGGMYYYAVSTLKARTLDRLCMEVIDHKEAIDRFLTERTMDLQLVTANLGLKSLTRPGALEAVFHSLQSGRIGPCFLDLGIIDDQGRHLAYVGPYELISKNYREAQWFRAVMENDVYISDVFPGFRNVPHFIIAVKQVGEEGIWMVRATVDTAHFHDIVSGITSERKGDAYLVNRSGIFQTSPRTAGQLMGQSAFNDPKPFEGVKLEEQAGNLRATVWLENVPWLCVVQVDKGEIFSALHRVRNIGIFVFVLGGILIVFTVLLTTNHLVLRLETKRRSIRFLDHQLRHTSKAASTVLLASGFIRDINDRLSNIDLAARWVQDLIRKDSSREENRNEMKASLDEILSEVALARKTTDRFSKATRRDLPIIKDMEINDLLDDILELLDGELHFKKIEVERDYSERLPRLRSDPSQVRQVFQNLILNAMSALQREGKIALTTRGSDEGVTVIVADNGPGIAEEHREKIFDPLFTTHPDGTGLGLSICADILQKLGGRISVKSEPGRGTAFEVRLPLEPGFPGS
jgi:two-component system NtrC family sensor kinase